LICITLDILCVAHYQNYATQFIAQKMKYMPKLLNYIVLFLLPFSVFAQKDIQFDILEEDLGLEKSSKQSKSGVYMSITSAYTVVDSQDAFIFGCKGGAIIGNNIVAGIGGNFYMNGSRTNPLFGNYEFDFNTEGIYGFIFSEIIFRPKKKVHLNIPLSFGMGTVAYVTDYYDYFKDQWIYSTISSDKYIVFEPGIEVEIAVSPYARIGFDVLYRFTSELELKAMDIYQQERLVIPTNAIQSLSLGISFKLGLYTRDFE